MVIVLMGVAGAGKTTVGRRLSEELQWAFLDGDAVHPPENIAKISSGVPLSDDDRRPWLDAVRRVIAEWISQNRDGVVACSLLKQAHRAAWRSPSRDITLFRLRRAEAAGLSYHDYMLRLLDSGRYPQAGDPVTPDGKDDVK